MRVLAFTFLTIGLVTAAEQAPAQTYDPAFPVCAHVVPWGGGSFEDCTYHTMAQCAASASGRAAQCQLNPFYARAAAPRQGERRYRRGY
ncbi:DUF3551 domain-containing protein [Bradyrhizobium sp. JYMT SZCCT0180]|uniref:DUF3551 domain-containing protein n=1 Tax=Bradyrhizobium sp. JYMT SZCCT0180 TaxID=2807666 RepID=UPI001BA62122|nr:DUF3551 domain-containing protein [Bradyrhizobium sp. JYMT SZCCT0180]MBR1216287.1 DUF3551 domain-containing protein [Bradyrhizobium sp. JYMT SZCCT0180]